MHACMYQTWNKHLSPSDPTYPPTPTPLWINHKNPSDLDIEEFPNFEHHLDPVVEAHARPLLFSLRVIQGKKPSLILMIMIMMLLMTISSFTSEILLASHRGSSKQQTTKPEKESRHCWWWWCSSLVSWLLGVNDTPVFLLNEYIVEVNPANFNILNQILNWIFLKFFKLIIFLNWIF